MYAETAVKEITAAGPDRKAVGALDQLLIQNITGDIAGA
jgi:hypothetical protein